MKTTIFSFAFLLLICLSHSQTTTNTANPSLLSVTGNGQVNVAPTQAQFIVGVVVRNDSVAQAAGSAQNASQTTLNFLTAQGVNASDIQSSFFSFQPVFGNNVSTDSVPLYYTGEQSITFLLLNLTNFDTILQGLFQNGVNSVNSITFQVANETTSIQQARQAALNNAQDIANDIANQLSLNIGNVYSVSDQTAVQQPVPISIADLAIPSTNSGNAVAGGQIQVTSTVQVAYNIS